MEGKGEKLHFNVIAILKIKKEHKTQSRTVQYQFLYISLSVLSSVAEITKVYELQTSFLLVGALLRIVSKKILSFKFSVSVCVFRTLMIFDVKLIFISVERKQGKAAKKDYAERKVGWGSSVFIGWHGNIDSFVLLQGGGGKEFWVSLA